MPHTWLFLIGGAANKTLLRFAKASGGRKSHIVILPHASATPAKVGRELALSFKKAGAGQTSIIMPCSQTNIPSDATAVYLAGGSQSRLIERMPRSLVGQLKEFVLRRGLIGATSASSAAMAVTMIADGMNNGLARANALVLKPGLGLVEGVVIDTHFTQRARFARLMTATVLVPGTLGIGLDEDTALEVKDNRIATVCGDGHAWLFTAGAQHKSNLLDIGPKKTASIAGVQVTCLSAGQCYDLNNQSWLTKL